LVEDFRTFRWQYPELVMKQSEKYLQYIYPTV
jgi:hypothetical protein